VRAEVAPRRTLIAQRLPLIHTKAVLLIDNGQSQVVEGDAFLDEGVGTNGQVEIARGQVGVDACFFGGRGAAGEQANAQAKRSQQRL